MDALRLYLDVARLHSFSQAAELHGITQSAASQRIHALEKRLGVTLIDRSVRPLGLTDAGRTFLVGVEDLLERYDRLERKVAGMRPAAEEGVVRVTAIYSAGIDLLSDIRERFEAAHPGIEVEIQYDQPDRVHQAVLDHECDLGILSYPHRWKKVGFVPLRDETMVVVCRPVHPLASRKKLHAEALSSYEMVAFEAELPVSRAIRAYLRENDASPKVTAVFDNIDTIKGAVEVTDQIAILPRRTVKREVAGGALAMVELEPRLTRPMGIIYRKRGKEAFDGAVKTFVEFLIQHAGASAEKAEEQASKQRELVGARS